MVMITLCGDGRAHGYANRRDSRTQVDAALDFLRGNVEVAETFSNGQFGTPKTRSSRRVIPMSSVLREALELHRRGSAHTAPQVVT